MKFWSKRLFELLKNHFAWKYVQRSGKMLFSKKYADLPKARLIAKLIAIYIIGQLYCGIFYKDK